MLEYWNDGGKSLPASLYEREENNGDGGRGMMEE